MPLGPRQGCKCFLHRFDIGNRSEIRCGSRIVTFGLHLRQRFGIFLVKRMVFITRTSAEKKGLVRNVAVQQLVHFHLWHSCSVPCISVSCTGRVGVFRCPRNIFFNILAKSVEDVQAYVAVSAIPCCKPCIYFFF